MADRAYSEVTVDAEDQFTDWLTVDGQLLDIHLMNVTDSTVTLQKKFTDSGTVYDEKAYTDDDHEVLEMPGRAMYRLGVKAGGFGTDTPVCRIQIGPK
jgi:hypothetical protein